MSFKREGDDHSQLNLLKKRRVSDLLADDIPEDEAFLMSSGRYACTVCNHRPVFDTIAMLLVHRNGKKHIGNVKRYYAKKQDLMREVEKRKQLLHLRQEQGDSTTREEVHDAAPLLTKTRKATHHALLKAAPYKGYARPTPQHDGNTNSHTKESFFQRVAGNSSGQDVGATQSLSLPGNRDPPSSVQSDGSVSGSSSHDAKGKNSISQSDDFMAGRTSCKVNVKSFEGPLTVLEKRSQTSIQLKPYVSKRQRSAGLTTAQSDHRQEVSESSSDFCKDLGSSHQFTSRSEEPATSEKDLNQREGSRTCVVDVGTEPSLPPTTCEKQLAPLKTAGGKVKKPHKKNNRESANVGKDLKGTDRDRYLQMTSSGWKPDWKGGWVQDQDVEFDSDEEEPP